MNKDSSKRRGVSGSRFLNRFLDAEAVRAHGEVELIKQLAARKDETLSRHDETIDSLLREITEHVVADDHSEVGDIARRNFAGLKAYFAQLAIPYEGSDFDFDHHAASYSGTYDSIVAVVYRARGIYDAWRRKQVEVTSNEIELMLRRLGEKRET